MDNIVTPDASPFHAGERAVQERLGYHDRVGPRAARVIRDRMPDQHRDFFAGLPFIMLGGADAAGDIWASLVPGQPGFLSSPDARVLHMAALPLPGDPLADALRPGAEVGLLGIELETRRRNRVNGRVAASGPDGMTVTVKQSFGNCPLYIQTRDVVPAGGRAAAAGTIDMGERIDEAARAVVERADTFFIATAWLDAADAPSRGADVSHRGGRPGFVRLADENTLVFPDFAGNRHYNTLGNLALNPKAGLVFPDFDSGDIVTMTGTADVIWDGPEVESFTGAERLVRFQAEKVMRMQDALPFRFGPAEASPALAKTGHW